MQKRVKKAERIVDVQRQIQRAETWRLENLKHTIADIEAAEVEVIAALNSDDALHGLFIEARARRLRALNEDRSRALVELEHQTAVVLEQSSKLKGAERLLKDVTEEADRAAEQAELQEVIERAVAAGDASLP